MVEQVGNRRVQAIKLLKETDAYEMASMISANVADILKFLDDLGTLFRNGTLATYICPVSSTAPDSCAGLTVPSPFGACSNRIPFEVFALSSQN